jgi:hypothetical protein
VLSTEAVAAMGLADGRIVLDPARATPSILTLLQLRRLESRAIADVRGPEPYAAATRSTARTCARTWAGERLPAGSSTVNAAASGRWWFCQLLAVPCSQWWW